MLNYAQETPLTLYNTSQVFFFQDLLYLSLHNFLVCIIGPTVKNLSVLGVHLKLSPHFFKEKTICTSVDSTGDSEKLQEYQGQKNFKKIKILNKHFAESTWAVVDGPKFNIGFKS